jgi:alpha-glucosidase (family GH31 glycosyl hydrolase)
VCAAAPARADTTVETDALRATVRSAPFALELADRQDGDALRTLTAGGRDGGLAYGFDIRIPIVNNAFFGYLIQARADTLWFRATGVRSARREGDGVRLDLTTDDPLGHRIEATVRPAAQGAVALTTRLAPGSGPLAALGPSSMSASFARADGERYLGFGERSNAVDQTGRSVFNWAEEGPFSSGNAEDPLRPLIPDFTFPNGPATTNFPIPWLVSTRGLGVLIDQTHRSTFHLGDERRGAWRAEAEAKSLALTFYPGPDPAGVLRRYSAAVGRQPAPSGWLFGAWGQFDDATGRRLRERDVPVTVNQTYTHYLPCGVHVGRDEAERKRVAAARALGYRITTYFNPHVCTSYERVYAEAAREKLLVRNLLGSPYLLTNPFTADQIVSEIDFTRARARDLFGRLLDEAIDNGYDGWMEDFGEYTPPDAVFSDGRNGAEMHNRYPVLYHCASTDHTARRGGDFAVFIRSGYHGVQPCARAVWGGDPTEDWSCSDGLCAAVHQALSIGLSGIAYWGSDIGGFHAIVNGRTTDELNTRWLQFGAVSGIMRTQSNGYSLVSPRSRRSQVTSDAVLPAWRRYTKLRTQLYPYIQAASRAYRRTGLPLTRALALTYPGDPRAVAAQEEFMFGPDLLAAPVVRRGARTRRLHLPAGRWIDVWRSVAYDERGGGLRLGRVRELDGGRDVTLPAPLDELPLLARAGTLLPLLPPDVDTLDDRGPNAAFVRLRQRRYRLVVLAFPRGRSRADLGTGARARSIEGRRSWRLDLRGVRRRHTFQVRASLLTLRRPFVPCRVVLRSGGKTRVLPRGRWRYSRATGVLRVTVTARRASLVARPCAARRAE